MDEDIIHRLRRDGQLTRLPGGEEGVPITLQFKGKVPALARPERKQWLEGVFSDWKTTTASHLPMQIDPQSLSLSGQTVDGVGSVRQLESIRQAAALDGFHVEIARRVQAAPDF